MNWNLNGPSIVLSADGADNNNANSNNIIFTIKGKKLYVPVVNVSTKDNQKLSKLISIGFERSVYWNRWKTKSGIKIQQMNIGNLRCFLKSNLFGVIRLFVLVFPNQDANSAKK